MNALNISRLNAIAPYTVWSTIDGIYCFKTDYDVVYRIRIEDDHNIPNLDTIIRDFDNFVGFFTNKPE